MGLWYILIGIGVLIGLLFVIDWRLFGWPKKDSKNMNFPSKYWIPQRTFIAYQSENQCAGFSTAYVLRYLGEAVQGKEMYDRLPGKWKIGAVMPKSIKQYLETKGRTCLYLKGNLDTLKMQISQGNPMIVFLRTYPQKPYLHYAVVVGYEEEKIYLADSFFPLQNCETPLYNRVLSTEEFMQIWNTASFYMPCHKYTYLLIQ